MADQASHPTTTRTTGALSEECIILFNVFFEHQPRWSEDQLARFKIWIANLGIFENGHASIDYRLRDHPNVLGLVTQQLNVLKVNLEKLKSLVAGLVEPQVQKQGISRAESFDIDGEEFVYESPTSEDSFSDVEFENTGQLNLKLLNGLQTVEDTIARLNALATAIRRSGKQSRTSKADLYEVLEDIDGVQVNLTNEFQKYASAIVAREIPDAESFLKERLTLSIVRRRNRFLYWKRHDKTSNVYVRKVIPSGLIKQPATAPQPNIAQTENLNPEKPNFPSDQRTTISGFTATTFDAKEFRRPTESAMGSIKTTGSVRWKNRDEFPKPPMVGVKESHFLCPICLILSPIKEAKGDLWVQHVTRDLKPYICIFNGCKTPHTVFDSFQDWIRHIKEEQMSTEWHCASASHPPVKFDTQVLFESHVREQHQSGFIEAQLPALARRNMRFASDVFKCCPFCSYIIEEDSSKQSSIVRGQDELQHHISSHLISLAFISLPPLSTGDSSESDRIDSSGVDSSVAAVDSRMDHSETMEPLRFDDISYDPDPVEGYIRPVHNSEWDFLGKRTVPDDNYPDSIFGRSCGNVAHQQEEFIDNSLRAPVGDVPGVGIIGASSHKENVFESTESTVVDRVLPWEPTEIAVPLTPIREDRSEELEKVQRQTVEDRQNMLGSEHPETLTGINNLGQVLFSRGQYKEAVMFYRQALAGREKVLGKGHLDTIKSLNNLAQALVYLGHFREAEELYEQALEEGEKTLWLDHPDVLQNIHNLGGALRNQGQHTRAEKLYRQALAGREKILGTDHPDTLQSVNNLGGTFEQMGQYAPAEELYRQALVGREKVLGLHHADTLQSVHNVAGALRNQGRYKEAENLYRQALTGREKTLGRKHPNTLKSFNNLALAIEAQGKYAEAEEIYRQVLVVRKEVLGNEHLGTFQSIHNIGSVRLKQSDYTEAECLYRQALEGRAKVLGQEHPDTLQSISNLGKALELLDRLDEAEVLYRQALEGKEKLLGQEHPHTLQSAEDLASLLERRGKIHDAEK